VVLHRFPTAGHAELGTPKSVFSQMLNTIGCPVAWVAAASASRIVSWRWMVDWTFWTSAGMLQSSYLR
jgi:hypothetical protein